MNSPNALPVSRFRRTMKISFVLLVLSFCAAIFLFNSGVFWSFISWLPRSITHETIGFLNSVIAPIQPQDVHSQEENLEFFTAWLFSIISLIILYLLFVVIRRVIHVRLANAL